MVRVLHPIVDERTRWKLYWLSIFCLYFTGHGGAEAATFAKEHLINLIVNQKAFWSDDDRDVLRAIREGYIATHYAMWREQGKYFSSEEIWNAQTEIASS